MSPASTPASLGYRPVAEWEPNARCYCAWPYDAVAWSGYLEPAQREFVAFCRALAASPESERILMFVSDSDAERDARSALAGLGAAVDFERFAYGDIWLRDTTPLFLQGAQGLGAVCFGFNGWGGKYIYPPDLDLSVRLAERSGVPRFSFETILEGGAVEFDGRGTCLTTTSCLLNPNRGRGLTTRALDRVLGDAFATTKVIWLDSGLAGDHTDGHIDNIARFVAPATVMVTRTPDRSDPNYAVYEEIYARLSHETDALGNPLRVLTVPSPGLVPDRAGEPLAASHLNFYLGNRIVVVPGFGTASDEAARTAIAAAFPERLVVLSPARTILEWGGGTFHCMTRQEPRRTA